MNQLDGGTLIAILLLIGVFIIGIKIISKEGSKQSEIFATKRIVYGVLFAVGIISSFFVFLGSEELRDIEFVYGFIAVLVALIESFDNTRLQKVAEKKEAEQEKQKHEDKIIRTEDVKDIQLAIVYWRVNKNDIDVIDMRNVK